MTARTRGAATGARRFFTVLLLHCTVTSWLVRSCVGGVVVDCGCCGAGSGTLRFRLPQFFPRSVRFDAGDIKGFTLLISVRNDHRPMYQLHLVRTNGHLVKMEPAPSYVDRAVLVG